jgi:hypothetical protein
MMSAATTACLGAAEHPVRTAARTPATAPLPGRGSTTDERSSATKVSGTPQGGQVVIVAPSDLGTACPRANLMYGSDAPRVT